MAIKKLPVLPEDYPVFDWSDHQSSYDALVAGGLVSNFKKETWNAIVDTINNVLIEAGFEWDGIYTTSDEAKIGVAYGALSAEMFNSVRHNIDSTIALGWGWASKPDFRGYVGREDFYGMSTHGKKADLFYPEYLKELVRRLNMLIEILKDAGHLEHVIGFDSSNSIYILPWRVDKSGIHVTRAMSKSKPYLPLHPDYSAIWLSRALVGTIYDSKLMIDRSATMNLTHESSINQKSPLIVDLSSLLGTSSCSLTSEKSKVRIDKSAIRQAFGRTMSDSLALLIADRPAYTESKWLSKAIYDAFMDLDRPNYVKAVWSGKSSSYVSARLDRSVLKELRWSAKSVLDAEMNLDGSAIKQTRCTSKDMVIGILSYIGHASLFYRQGQYTRFIATGDALAVSHLFSNRNQSTQSHFAACESIAAYRMTPEKHLAKSLIIDMLGIPRASILDGEKYLMLSSHRSELVSFRSYSIETFDYLIKTDSLGALSVCRDAVVIPEKRLAVSNSSGLVNAISAFGVSLRGDKVVSFSEGAINLPKPDEVAGRNPSASDSAAAVETAKPSIFDTGDKSESISVGKLISDGLADQNGKNKSTSKIVAQMIAWKMPKVVDGVLYIEQVFSGIQNIDTLEIDLESENVYWANAKVEDGILNLVFAETVTQDGNEVILN